MAIYKKGANVPDKKTFIITIYGEEFTRKSSLSITAKNPFMFQTDGGLHRIHNVNNIDKMIPENWDEIANFIKDGNCDDYDTIILDTVKTALDDFLIESVLIDNPDLKAPTGGPTPTGWGVAAKKFREEFKEKIKSRVIIFVAHAKEKTEHEVISHIPNITGQTMDSIMQMSDQVGYSYKEGENVILDFRSSGNWKSKDTAQIGKLVLPDKSDPSWNTFMQDAIIDPLIEKMRLSDAKTVEATDKALEYTLTTTQSKAVIVESSMTESIPNMIIASTTPSIDNSTTEQPTEQPSKEGKISLRDGIVADEPLAYVPDKFEDCTTPEELNGFMSRLKGQDMTNAAKKILFNKMHKHATNRGWEYDEKTKSFWSLIKN